MVHFSPSTDLTRRTGDRLKHVLNYRCSQYASQDDATSSYWFIDSWRDN